MGDGHIGLKNHFTFSKSKIISFFSPSLSPLVNFLTRVLSTNVAGEAISRFDEMVTTTFQTVLKLPPLSQAATKQLHWPLRHAGMGLRSLSGAHPAAFWSACVRALPDVQPLLPPDLSTCPAPFMNCIRTAHRLLQQAGLTADAPPGMRELLPPTANDILSFYGTPDSPICNLPPHFAEGLVSCRRRA